MIEDGIFSATAETLAESLSYTAILKLSLIKWPFDALGAPSEELACFLRWPSHNEVWETLRDSY